MSVINPYKQSSGAYSIASWQVTPDLWNSISGNTTISKFLIKYQDKICLLSQGEWLDTGLTEPSTQENYEIYGMDSLGDIPSEKWNELVDGFEILAWTDADNPPQIEITVPPFRPLDKLNNQFSIVMGEYKLE